MSKVNVDEIKVGDLIGFDNYNKKIVLGYVTEIKTPVVGCTQFWCHFSCNKVPEVIGFLHDYNIDYHWKVVNFDEQSESPYTEEESKVDELKVYTGKETLQALLEGKTLSWATDQYKLDGSRLLEKNGPNEWARSYRSLDHFMKEVLTEVATPQVGDWVRAIVNGKTYTAKVNNENVYSDSHKLWANWNTHGNETYIDILDTKMTTHWEILSPEQVSEYKREQAFVKVGRKLNEFRSDDFALINSTSEVAVVVSNNNDESVRLHVLNQGGKGYTAKPHQLTPIYFKDNQVCL